MNKVTFEEVVERTRAVIKTFEKIEGRKWGIEGTIIELYKQVGSLSQQIMGMENYYPKKVIEAKVGASKQQIKAQIADELSDVLFMIIRISYHYRIDLLKEHLKHLKIADERMDSIKP